METRVAPIQTIAKPFSDPVSLVISINLGGCLRSTKQQMGRSSMGMVQSREAKTKRQSLSEAT